MSIQLVVLSLTVIILSIACGPRSPEYYQDNLDDHWDTFNAYNAYAGSLFSGGNFIQQRTLLCSTYKQWHRPLQESYEFLLDFKRDAPDAYESSNAPRLLTFVDWGLRNMQSFDEDCP